ncbi:MAG: L-threonylcarbamoyladenylate synthase [Patescibacteria group bacterium]
MNDQITEAVTVLSQGGIIIFPTDTAFGIGCRLDKPESVDRLFALRKRPSTQAMPVLVDSIAMALSYLDSPGDIVRRMMQAHWPGGLTIVAPCKTDRIYSPIRGGGTTIGVRMPDHEITRSIITGATVPILGSSANFHGEKTPFHLTDLDPQLVQLVDYVVSGSCKVGKASTVVDTTQTPAVIVREGAVHLAPHELL